MLHNDPREPRYYLWRFMIAGEHQGKGYGRRAMELRIEHVKTRPGAKELLLSYVPGEGSPEGFYRRLGFELTGEENEGKIMARLRLREGENPSVFSTLPNYRVSSPVLRAPKSEGCLGRQLLSIRAQPLRARGTLAGSTRSFRGVRRCRCRRNGSARAPI